VTRIAAKDPKDDRALDGYPKLAWAFDELFRIPGTQFRFGLDAIIGLVPGVSDIAVSALGAYALMPGVQAARTGAGAGTDAAQHRG